MPDRALSPPPSRSLCWTASSSVFELKAQDDGDNRWWDLDFESEEYAVFNIALNMAFLVVSTLALAVPIARVWHPAKGSYDRYHLGALAAALFFTCNMLLVSFWYSIDIPVSRTALRGLFSRT